MDFTNFRTFRVHNFLESSDVKLREFLHLALYVFC